MIESWYKKYHIFLWFKIVSVISILFWVTFQLYYIFPIKAFHFFSIEQVFVDWAMLLFFFAYNIILVLWWYYIIYILEKIIPTLWFRWLFFIAWFIGLKFLTEWMGVKSLISYSWLIIFLVPFMHFLFKHRKENPLILILLSCFYFFFGIINNITQQYNFVKINDTDYRVHYMNDKYIFTSSGLILDMEWNIYFTK